MAAYIVATDDQDSPVVVGPFRDYADDQIEAARDEIEEAGWISMGRARKLTMVEFRREVR